MKVRSVIRSAISLLGVILMCGAAAAQTYPEKPVRVVVPASPGGAADIMARHVSLKLGEAFGVQFIVDNRSGASGEIGAVMVNRAAPDGYTLLFTSSTSVSIYPHFAVKPMNPLTSFSPIILIGHTSNALVVHPSVPAKSVNELIAYAKTQPNPITYASNGTGSLSHLTAVMFEQSAGIRMLHVPYKGAGPAVIGVISGEASVLLAAYPSVSVQERSGKLRILAVTSAERMKGLPNVPTLAETFPGFLSNQWWGIYGPPGLPGNVRTRINAEANKILRLDDIKKRFAAESSETAGGTPEEFAAYHKADFEKWGRVIKSAGIKVE